MTPQIWGYRLLFVLLGTLAIAYPLLPLQFSPERLAPPDLLLALVLAWLVRQPKSAPLLLIAALALFADAVLMRPLGLWAGLTLLASEIIRHSARTIQERGFLMEFTSFAALLIAMAVIQNILLWASFSQPLDLRNTAQFVLLTLVCYPVIVLCMHYILRIRKPDHKNRPDRLGKIR
ncbi:MAG: hypothetical protein L3J37_01030 [Rhodobacteraceae bacterium]|nr:hypothetical protein [Paracoccaceae bacterium]